MRTRTQISRRRAGSVALRRPVRLEARRRVHLVAQAVDSAARAVDLDRARRRVRLVRRLAGVPLARPLARLVEHLRRARSVGRPRRVVSVVHPSAVSDQLLRRRVRSVARLQRPRLVRQLLPLRAADCSVGEVRRPGRSALPQRRALLVPLRLRVVSAHRRQVPLVLPRRRRAHLALPRRMRSEPRQRQALLVLLLRRARSVLRLPRRLLSALRLRQARLEPRPRRAHLELQRRQHPHLALRPRQVRSVLHLPLVVDCLVRRRLQAVDCLARLRLRHLPLVRRRRHWEVLAHQSPREGCSVRHPLQRPLVVYLVAAQRQPLVSPGRRQRSVRRQRRVEACSAPPLRQLVVDYLAHRLLQQVRADFSAPLRRQRRLALVASAHRPPHRLLDNLPRQRGVCLAALLRRRLQAAASLEPLQRRREVCSEPQPLHLVALAVAYSELQSLPQGGSLEQRPPLVRLSVADSLVRARPPPLQAAACLAQLRLPEVVFSALLHRLPGAVSLVVV